MGGVGTEWEGEQMCVSFQLWHHAEGEEALLTLLDACRQTHMHRVMSDVCVFVCVCARNDLPFCNKAEKKSAYYAVFAQTLCLSDCGNSSFSTSLVFFTS